MTEAQSDEHRLHHGLTYEAIGSHLNAGHVADVIQETLDDITQKLNGNIRAIQRLIPYLSGLYYADTQRRYAERELFRLQKERTELESHIHNALVDRKSVV